MLHTSEWGAPEVESESVWEVLPETIDSLPGLTLTVPSGLLTTLTPNWLESWDTSWSRWSSNPSTLLVEAVPCEIDWLSDAI